MDDVMRHGVMDEWRHGNQQPQTEFSLVTLDHKTSHEGPFLKIEIYTSSESWINKLSIDVWFVRIEQYLAEIQLFENQ